MISPVLRLSSGAKATPAAMRSAMPEGGSRLPASVIVPTALSPAAVLAETRQRGYAIEESEVTDGMASVAAAVLDHNEMPVAGVAITYPTDGPGTDQQDRLARAVVATAQQLSRRLRGR